MRKPMTVLTTHPGLYAQLHGRKCLNHSHHQTIEGRTWFENHPMLRTEFSEAYPRKFSRLIAKVLTQSPFQRPFNWAVGAWCQVAEALPALGQRSVRSVFRQPEPPSTLTCNFHASKAIDRADSKVMMWRPQQKQLDSVYELYYAYCPNVLCI